MQKKSTNQTIIKMQQATSIKEICNNINAATTKQSQGEQDQRQVLE
ncbi:hypothetical protein GH794_15730 [Listeria monocytogenes]|nr:hypothetical protein [Listeria monocytogenes]